MPGFDWNGNGKKDSFDRFMDYKVTSKTANKSNSSTNKNRGTGSGSSFRFGWGWGVIVIVVILLFSFIADGASWDAIDTLLGLGFLAFLFFRWIST